MECLFEIYSSIMENVYAGNMESSGMSGTKIVPVQKRNNYRILIKAVSLLKQSCSVHYKHLFNSKVKNT